MIKYQVEYKLAYSLNTPDLLIISAEITCLGSDLAVGADIFVANGVNLDPDANNRLFSANSIQNNFGTLKAAQTWAATVRADIEGQHCVYGKLTKAEPEPQGAVKVYVVE